MNQSRVSIIICFIVALFSSFAALAQTSSAPSYNDPEWAKKVVWYQIFPERFRNGDRSNDPSLLDTRGSYPFDSTSAWQIHNWRSDWYELQPYEKENGQDIWFNLQRRRYGGDVQGIIDKLDYLQRLGVNALYINPLFMAPSSHKYDASCYHHIDPTFGPDPVGDRLTMATEIPENPKTWRWTKADKLALKLIRECHKRGMYIIFDGVFNHMGTMSFAFRDVKRNQEKSIFKDWFDIESFANAAKGTSFKYKGWWGVQTLPELKEDAKGIVKGPKDYIFACTKRWMDPNDDGSPNDGIDGWRLDVAFCVAHPFWKDWHQWVRDINPNAYTSAEIIDNLDKVTPYVKPEEFQAVMNYNFSFITSEYFISEKNRIKTTVFDSLMATVRTAFDYGTSLRMQNLYDSHDTDRLLSRIVNRDQVPFLSWQKYFDISHGRDANYDTRKPLLFEKAVQKLMVTFQMTYPGTPMVYYGDEVGMWGATDPDCRKPMIWDDYVHEVERVLPNQKVRQTPNNVEIDGDIYDHYRRVIGIRRKYDILQTGDFKTILTDDARCMYAFTRKKGDATIYVILNNNTKPQGATIELPSYQTYRDLLTDHDYESDDAPNAPNIESRVFSVPAQGALILINKRYVKQEKR